MSSVYPSADTGRPRPTPRSIQPFVPTAEPGPRPGGHAPCYAMAQAVLPGLDGWSIVMATGGETEAWSPFSRTPRSRIQQ